MAKKRGAGSRKQSARKGRGKQKNSAQQPGQLEHVGAVADVIELETVVDRVGPQLTLEQDPRARKQRDKGGLPVRLTTHKARGKWFQSRSSWPVREAPIAMLVDERTRVRKASPPAPGTALWECVGPTNVGGRLTCIACDPNRPERIWVGAAGGGVWYSPDGGLNWQPQWHDQDVLNVGSIAVDPKDANIIYAGTGEANLSADSYGGVGIYQSVDGGRTWRLLAPAGVGGLPSRIGAISIDPFDRRHIRVGGVGFEEVGRGDSGGMYTSRDGGVTWQRESFVTTKNYWCHNILFHPSKQGTIFATITERGARNGFYRTTDDGKTWVQLYKGLPSPARMGRASIALCRAKPNVLYAYVRDEKSEFSDKVLGVFRSTDGGDNWRDVSGTHFKQEGQTSYNNTIAVHPTDPNHVICGGVEMHLTRDGGKTWRRVTKWDAVRGKPNYAHADTHGLLMPPGRPGFVYAVNDGGLDVSEHGGERWTNRSRGLAVTMYYDMDVAQTDGRVFGGGSQDNGTLITRSGRSDDHYEIVGGDGGWIVWDPTNSTRVFASYYNLNIFRHQNSRWRNVSPTDDAYEKNRVWMAYITLDPNNPLIVFTGSHRVWRSTNGGDSWRAVSPELDGSVITAIEVATARSRRVYIGTENGGIYRSDDGGNTWTPNLSSATLPGHSITRLETRPDNADVVYVTLANFGHAHVFRSSDGAISWEDVDRGQLPDVPHHSVVIPPSEPNTVYVCNDVGVFVSHDDANTWLDLTRNLPRAMVMDIVYHERDQTLSAATYGRSIWRLSLKS